MAEEQRDDHGRWTAGGAAAKSEVAGRASIAAQKLSSQAQEDTKGSHADRGNRFFATRASSSHEAAWKAHTAAAEAHGVAAEHHFGVAASSKDNATEHFNKGRQHRASQERAKDRADYHRNMMSAEYQKGY